MTHPIIRWIVVAAASLMIGPGAYATHRADELFVGFDLPDDYWQRTPEREYWVTGFRVGYFRANGQLPVMTVEFDRSTVVTDGGTGQLPLDTEWLATRRERFVVRLQTLTLDIESDWSAPSEAISISPLDAH